MSAQKKSKKKNPETTSITEDIVSSSPHEVASVVIETPANSRTIEEPIEGRAWQIAQLATSLLSNSSLISSDLKGTRAWKEDYFLSRVEESVRKARIILDVSSTLEDEETRLSTWFEPNSPISIKGVCLRLREIGWKTHGRGTSTPTYNTVKAQLDRIRDKWQAKLDDLRTRSNEGYDKSHRGADRVAGAIRELCSEAGLLSELPHLEKESAEFLKRIYQQVIYSDHDVHRINFERHDSLFVWCFMDRSNSRSRAASQNFAEEEECSGKIYSAPNDNTDNSQESDDEKGSEQIFRIHELLRFAEDQWETESAEGNFLKRVGEITVEESENLASSAFEWLPIHFRPRRLSSLILASPKHNCPLPAKLSFEAFNTNGCKSPMERYPWEC